MVKPKRKNRILPRILFIEVSDLWHRIIKPAFRLDGSWWSLF